MRLIRTVLFGVVLCTGASAASREIVELQREVAALQEQMRTTERALNERIAALQAVVQQTLDVSNRTSGAVTAVETGIRDRLGEQLKTLAGPVAVIGAKLDQMTSEFQNVQNQVSDLTSRMGKMEAQIVDLSNAIKTMNAPPAPPPTAGSTPGASAATPPAGTSAKQIYDAALKDRSGGNLDLAMAGFTEYLRYFGNTELAPNAQFYIGEIHYNKGELENAVKAFDVVLERYSENNKTPDAMYMKAMALLKSGQRTEAGREFATVIQKFPRSEVAQKARTQRKALGLSQTPGAAGRPQR